MGEDQTANLPDDQDTDNNGIEDGEENPGTIASFDGTTLTIDIAGGGQVSGTVDASTGSVRDASTSTRPTTTRVHSTATASHDGGGDQSGQNESGDDNSGPGDGGSVCTTADLTPGTAVHEAELEGTTFEKVELVK